MPESVSVSLNIISSILSIAASIKSLVASGNYSKEEALNLYLRSKRGKYRKLFLEHDLRDAVFETMVISEDLLKQLHIEAKNCSKRHIAARKKADKVNNQMHKIQADIKAAECMCGVLRSLMLHNEGKLPEGDIFESWWRMYNCTQ